MISIHIHAFFLISSYRSSISGGEIGDFILITYHIFRKTKHTQFIFHLEFSPSSISWWGIDTTFIVWRKSLVRHLSWMHSLVRSRLVLISITRVVRYHSRELGSRRVSNLLWDSHPSNLEELSHCLPDLVQAGW